MPANVQKTKQPTIYTPYGPSFTVGTAGTPTNNNYVVDSGSYSSRVVPDTTTTNQGVISRVFRKDTNIPYYNSVDEYIANIDDMARAYLFRVLLAFPSSLGVNTNEVSYFAKSTNLPDISTEEISTYFMGMQNKMASVRRYPDWQITMYMDKNAALLKAFYSWNQLCHNYDSNIYGIPKEYSNNVQEIHLLDSKNLETNILTYKLVRAWPKTIANVALDYESNQFITMDITFSYQYFYIDKMSYTILGPGSSVEDSINPNSRPVVYSEND